MWEYRDIEIQADEWEEYQKLIRDLDINE